MASSISSSKMNSFERNIAILALAAFLVVSFAAINASWPDPGYRAERDAKNFFQHKVYNDLEGQVNVVLAGDSRVYRGLSPAAFDAALPGTQSFNFGFSSGGLNPTMFDAMDKLLTPNSGALRAVVMGVTPSTLATKSQENAEYLQYKKMKPPTMGEKYLANIQEFFRPLTMKRIRKVVRRTPFNDATVYLPNGWAKSDSANRDSTLALPSYETIFNDNQVSQSTIDDIVAKTKDWRAQGVIVLAYRPPTTPAMVALENAKSGFDETAFKRAFVKAGGMWVDVGTGYDTYDGSHLTPESTEKLSDLIARRIAATTKAH